MREVGPEHALKLVAVSLTTLAVMSCSGAAEEPILSQFFAASRLRDHTALQHFATVSFEPHSQGIVTTFEITNVSPAQHTPLDINTLAHVHDAAKKDVVELSVEDPRNPVDLRKYNGALVSKEVTISAPVKSPGGQTSQKTFIVRMERAILKGDTELAGRWIITGIKETTASAGTKPS